MRRWKQKDVGHVQVVDQEQEILQSYPVDSIKFEYFAPVFELCGAI